MQDVESTEYKYLNFVLTQPIWLELEKEKGEVLDWTVEEPKYSSGYIDKGIILTYSHLYPETPTHDMESALNFIVIPDGSIAEFFIYEVKKFVNSGVFRMIKSIDINSMVLTPNGVIIDDKAILSVNNIDIAMGIDEARRSEYVGVGDIVSLQDLIKCYISHST